MATAKAEAELDERLDEALAESSPASDTPYPVLLLLAGVGWLLSRLARGGASS